MWFVLDQVVAAVCGNLQFAEKPGRKARAWPLDAHADWLLALVAGEPDLTLAEIEARLLEERQFKTHTAPIQL
ncbi:MAG: hypothetical protein HYS63_06680 [Methylocystis sp.]|nr:hypothetical protein [Methylocystis sp.]